MTADARGLDRAQAGPVTRVPVPVLVAAAVLGLLTGLTAVVATSGDEPPPARSTSAGAESDTVRLLRSWDRRRARAYRRGDPSALSKLYVGGPAPAPPTWPCCAGTSTATCA